MAQMTAPKAVGVIVLGTVLLVFMGLTEWRKQAIYFVSGLVIIGYGIYALVRAVQDER